MAFSTLLCAFFEYFAIYNGFIPNAENRKRHAAATAAPAARHRGHPALRFQIETLKNKKPRDHSRGRQKPYA